MGDISLPYKVTTPNIAPPSPCTPKSIKRSSTTSKKFLWFLASPASPPPEKLSIHRLSSSSSTSSCFYTPRATTSTTLDTSFSRKLDFDDEEDDDDVVGVAIESKKTNGLSLWEKKIQFFNSLNSVLSMKGRKMIETMKKKFLIISKENIVNNNKSCDQVWYQKEVKGIRCKPMSDASFRFTGKSPAVIKFPAVVAVEEDKHAF